MEPTAPATNDIEEMIADQLERMESIDRHVERRIFQGNAFVNYKILIDMVEIAYREDAGKRLSAVMSEDERALIDHIAKTELDLTEEEVSKLIFDYDAMSKAAQQGRVEIGSPTVDPKLDDFDYFIRAIGMEETTPESRRLVRPLFRFFNVRFKAQEPALLRHGGLVRDGGERFKPIEDYQGRMLLQGGTPVADLVMKNILYDAFADDEQIDEAEWKVIAAFGRVVADYDDVVLERLLKERVLEDEVMEDLVNLSRDTRSMAPDRKRALAEEIIREKSYHPDVLRVVARRLQGFQALLEHAYRDHHLSTEEIELLRYSAKHVYGIRNETLFHQLLTRYDKDIRVVVVEDAPEETQGVPGLVALNGQTRRPTLPPAGGAAKRPGLSPLCEELAKTGCVIIPTTADRLQRVLERESPDMVHVQASNLEAAAPAFAAYATDRRTDPPPIVFSKEAVEGIADYLRLQRKK